MEMLMQLWRPARDGSGINWTICKSFASRSIQITTPAPHHSISLLHLATHLAVASELAICFFPVPILFIYWLGGDLAGGGRE